jgi:hypothetical protein
MALLNPETHDSRLFQQLGRFLDQARPLLRGESTVAEFTPGIDQERLARFVERLRGPLDSARAESCANPWLTAGLGHDEVRVSAVLAALWDRRRYGDEARSFLARFFAAAGTGYPDEVELANGYRIQTEHCLNGAVTERVDITVETCWSIVGIEVKIYADEGDNQLGRYVTAIATRARLMQRPKHKVIFLSPYHPKVNSEQVGKVNWRTVAQIAAQADQTSSAGWLIGQFGAYCYSLGS